MHGFETRELEPTIHCLSAIHISINRPVRLPPIYLSPLLLSLYCSHSSLFNLCHPTSVHVSQLPISLCHISLSVIHLSLPMPSLSATYLFLSPISLCHQIFLPHFSLCHPSLTATHLSLPKILFCLSSLSATRLSLQPSLPLS